MSVPSQSSQLPPGVPEGRFRFWSTFLAVLGCFLIFVIVLFIAYVPQRRLAPEVDLTRIPADEQWKFTAAGRQARFDEIRAKEQAAATSYSWIDRDKGIVQLPIERAMQLTLRDLNAAKKR
jgi:hypothetical protein